MPRSKVVVKKIEDRRRRRMRFSKRLKGLFKKAKELSILCNAQVGVIVFSETKDLIHFPDKEKSFDKIIAKYNAPQDKTKPHLEKPPLQLNAEEVERLRKKCDEQELIIISQMDCDKELGNLSMEQLNQIEKRMQNGINLVREKQWEQYEKTNVELQRRREHNEKIIAELLEHNEKTIAELQEHNKTTIAELQRTIQLMEEKRQQKEVLPLFPENGSSRKRVARFRFNANANS